MSTKNSTIVEDSGFVNRLVEVCASDQPAVIARLLDISYQAAKNYLNGRLPEANVLITISLKTPYSLHWLLTGNGEKFASNRILLDTPAISAQITELIKDECRRSVNELLNQSDVNAQGKVIVLKSEDIRVEQVVENARVSPKKRE